ncbi:MAG: TonB C-terminal domain-containing protein [Deltaproteobacteria bacterium]|jgi:TonB family protein|nr:TonB C-terminal domain-containing protein [Deltaproteobacteria bacterium]
MSALRLAAPPKDAFHRLSRQNLLLFLALAAWLHLCLFLGLERLGLGSLADTTLDMAAIPQPMELILELSPPAPESPPEALLEPIPEPPPQYLPQEDPPAPLQGAGALQAEYTGPEAERPLRPEELLDPLDNQVKTFSFSSSSQLLGDGEEAMAPTDSTVNVDEYAPPNKSYDSQVRAFVARHWILPPAARNNFQPGRFSASMTIGREGDILSIVVRESAGNTALDYAAMEALRGAAPYPPFPPEYAHLTQRSFLINFDYRAVIKNPSQATGHAGR